MIAAGRAAGGPYTHITDRQWARALEVYTVLEVGEIEQDARRRRFPASAARSSPRIASPPGAQSATTTSHRTSRTRCTARIPGSAKPHGVFTLATHPMRQAEAIKGGIKRLIAPRDRALGRPAPAAIPRETD